MEASTGSSDTPRRVSSGNSDLFKACQVNLALTKTGIVHIISDYCAAFPIVLIGNQIA
jgi:hypothetical protein